MSETLLQICGLSVRYPDGYQALADVDLHLEAGVALGLVGGSGSGKTTLLRAILGRLPAGSDVTGQILFQGRDLLRLDGRARRSLAGTAIGYVGQNPYSAFDPLRTVAHHIEESWRARRLIPPDGLAHKGMTAFGVPNAVRKVRQHPHEWSGGMLQRATTFAATSHHPALTLADEPTSALDQQLADAALDLLRSNDGALLLVSHDLDLVTRKVDQLVVFDRGRIVETGRASAVFRAPKSAVTARLIAASRPPALQRAAVTCDAAVQVRKVRKRYGHVVVADEVDLDVRRGEIVGIVGPSGSGKSSLLRLLSGQECPDAGTVQVQGRPLWSGRRGTSQPLGWAMPVFQDPVTSLDMRWPLWRTLVEPLQAAGRRVGAQEARQIARRELDRIGLSDISVERRPGALSVGQAQRVAIVRALIAGPTLLVADEPTASLDVQAATTAADLLRREADRGVAMVVVSHDRARLASYCDRIFGLDQGTLRAVESADSLNPTGSTAL